MVKMFAEVDQQQYPETLGNHRDILIIAITITITITITIIITITIRKSLYHQLSICFSFCMANGEADAQC